MENFNKKINNRFEQLQKGKLFTSNISGDEIWDIYLNSFEKDGIFRDPESSVHNCNHCKNFIRRYGNIVSIDSNLDVHTIFDVDVDKSSEYFNFVKLIKKRFEKVEILDVFVETFDSLNGLPYEVCKRTNPIFKLGVIQNHKIYTQEEADKYGGVVAGKTYQFNHFGLDLDRDHVDFSGDSIATIKSKHRSMREVFHRGLSELSIDTLELVSDLIKQGSLLNGESELDRVTKFRDMLKLFNETSDDKKGYFSWYHNNVYISSFRNNLIGELCTELTEGKELNKACNDWNIRVDPINYKKATTPITEKQREDARKFVEENGYIESFDRRLANISDINIEEISHMNINSDIVKPASIFDKIGTTKSTRFKRSEFDSIQEMSIDKFMSDVLPNSTSVEVLLENKHLNNLVVMTTSNNKDAKNMFKWGNNFAWTFKGGLSGKSQIKENVKKAGGNVNAELRMSLMWNESGNSIVDLDLHAYEPMSNNHIYFGSYKSPNKTNMSGQLDVDMINPRTIGVENITWTDRSLMADGVYRMLVHNYNSNHNDGFKAEVEFDGITYSFEYNGNAQGTIAVADISMRDGEFTIIPKLEMSTSSNEVWGLKVGEFHKLNLVCLSPNFWGDNNVGNKHYMFMIDGCRVDESIRTFHNEFLNGELSKYRKTLDVLASMTRIEPEGDNLSGLGFNSTVRDELIIKVSGTHKRVLKIKF